MPTSLQALRYPVGPMTRIREPLDAAARDAHLQIIAETPARFRALAQGLTDADLARTYRAGGWTLRQVFHHVPDSHLHAYLRMKLAVTEEVPTVKTYDEKLWSELADARTAPIEMSLLLLDGVHQRWLAFLRALSPAEWRRTFNHPEWGIVAIEESLTMYSWHSRHHAAHIEIGKQIRG